MELYDEDRRAAFVADGWWTGVTWSGQVERWARERPERPSLADPVNRTAFLPGPPRELTWGEVADEVRDLAAVLHAHGVRRGSVVAVQLPNCVELPIAMVAIARLGAVVSPFPVQYRRHELERMCALAGAEVFVTADQAVGRPLAAEARELVADVVTIDDIAPTAAQRDQADAYAASLDLTSADLVTIVWTSGTEGLPKGVPRGYGDWEVLGTATSQSPRLTGDDVLLNPFPMVNGGGLAGMFLPWLLHGTFLVQHHPFDIATFCEQVERHGVTYTCAPPPVLNALVSDGAPDRDLSTLRAVSSGSAPLSGWMIDAWERGRGVEVLNLFGSNEGGMLFAEPETVPDPAQRGRLFPRYGVPGMPYRTAVAAAMRSRLVDLTTGEEVTAPGQAGELRLQGPAIFSGYLGRGREGFDEDGWFCTGDVFEISAESADLLVHVDRAKDLVIRGGFKISAAEIENLLVADPRIAEVAAVGMPDPDLGERLCVYVVPAGPAADEPLTLDDVIAVVRAADVAKFKWPERLEIVDALPRNAIGKVLKRELRTRLQPTPTPSTPERSTS